jgi:hypothetical protein
MIDQPAPVDQEGAAGPRSQPKWNQLLRSPDNR